jgi:ribosome-associated translation inhibitor RaiA
MQTPLQITLRNIEPSEALNTLIRDRVSWLDKMLGQLIFKHIIFCLVVVESVQTNHPARQFNIHIGIGVPGVGMGVDRKHVADIYAALREAFDVAQRQLEDYIAGLYGHSDMAHVSKHGRRSGNAPFIQRVVVHDHHSHPGRPRNT